MGYLRGFDPDVFISYCHDDNEVADGRRGWVDQFAAQLSICLKQESGQRGRIRVWRDPELSRAEVLDRRIEELVRGSGILVALVSPAYRNSDYCAQELAWFGDAAARRPPGLEIGTYRRLVPVLLRDVPHDEWPELCRGPVGFTFHHTGGDEAGWPLDPDSKEFRRSLRRLVGDLWIILQEMQRAEQAPEPARVEDSEDEAQPLRVFLAQAPVDLVPIRERLLEGLTAPDFELLPDIPPPDAAAAHADAVEAAVREADLVVHLLGLHPGKELAGGGGTYPSEQLRIGLAHARSQLVLMPEEFRVEYVEDATYRQQLRSLTERERETDRLEVAPTGRHQMLDEVLAKRRRLLAARAGPTAEATAFIDLHPKDWARAGQLMAYLDERDVAWRMERSDEPSRFAAALRSARLFLVVFGAVARQWVEGRIKNALQLLVEENLSLPLAVYLASPDARRQAGFGRMVEVVHDLAGVDPLLDRDPDGG